MALAGSTSHAIIAVVLSNVIAGSKIRFWTSEWTTKLELHIYSLNVADEAREVKNEKTFLSFIYILFISKFAVSIAIVSAVASWKRDIYVHENEESKGKKVVKTTDKLQIVQK